jgi:cyclophilin family peptidyl-prolyl cis-trans isomerase
MKLKLIIILTLSIFLISCSGYDDSLQKQSTATGGNTMKTATFETNQGTFKLQLDTQKAPITAGNFIKLAEQGFYDGTKFHRVIPNFMAQGGDPLSKDESKRNRWGTGGPGYEIKDEFHPELNNNIGTISMANSGPNTGGSQFFINVANNNFLDNKHAVFGHVTEGIDIVNKIVKVPTHPNDQPRDDVVITKITIS